MISPSKRRASSTAAAVLPTPVGPAMMTRVWRLDNFDQQPKGEECGQDEDGEELFPLHASSPTLSRLRTRADSWAGPSVRRTARTSATRISSRPLRKLRRL